MVYQATTEHSKMMSKIKDMMDKKRALKTTEFKKKLVEKPQSSLKALIEAKLNKKDLEGVVDTNMILQEHNQKDNLFFRK